MEQRPEFQRMTAWIEELPQIVPERWCAACRVCCRFPDAQGVQAPSWSPLEADWAQDASGDLHPFDPVPNTPSLQVQLKACEQGYRCPVYDSSSNRCTIHPMRPLDCRLYPFALGRDSAGTKVVLAMDMKCPYLQAHGEDREILSHAMQLADYLESSMGGRYLQSNPAVVSSFWPEFISCAALPQMSAALQSSPAPPHSSLHPLTLQEVPRLNQALRQRPYHYSGYTAAGLLGWMDLIHFWWAEMEGAFCIFAEQAGGLFMPLPPLGKAFSPQAAAGCWEILCQANQGAGVSRIEGIEWAEAGLFAAEGFTLQEGEGEYFYRRDALVNLRGDQYRSQRGAINRCKRQGSFLLRPFTQDDLAACLKLCMRWGVGKQMKDAAPVPRALIRDAMFFHRRLLVDHEVLNLTGRVVEHEGVIRGYTFGAEVSPELFCVFLEVADPAIAGLSQWLFREFCEQLHAYRLINAMGDSHLPGLRQAKMAYAPAGIIPTRTAGKKRGKARREGSRSR